LLAPRIFQDVAFHAQQRVFAPLSGKLGLIRARSFSSSLFRHLLMQPAAQHLDIGAEIARTLCTGKPLFGHQLNGVLLELVSVRFAC
jgi:hypothetical protein